MNILYGIDPLDDSYAPAEGDPCLATLISNSSSKFNNSIKVPLFSKCLHFDESIVYYGLNPVIGLMGTKDEVLNSIYVQERLHKIKIVHSPKVGVNKLRDIAEVRDADIIIAMPPVWQFYDSEGGREVFYRTLKGISRDMRKKIVVLAEDIDDVVASKHHADITAVLIKNREEDNGECGHPTIIFDAVVYHTDQEDGSMLEDELSLEYCRTTCKWMESKQ
jgi:hypothetical protein